VLDVLVFEDGARKDLGNSNLRMNATMELFTHTDYE
jgi:hypothetical protein